MILVSQPCIIKASPKSDIAVIWINIWDFQNDTKEKMLINRCFNISQHIVIIRGINMNSGISQGKNCWKWKYITFTCCIHRFKCQKYNGLYKIKHYKDIAWYCKVTFKTNHSDSKPPKKYCTYIVSNIKAIIK